MLHLSASNPFWMIFEHLQDYFHLKDLVNGLLWLPQFCFHIAQGQIPP